MLSLTGHSIFLLEDEPLIALDVMECLREHGAVVLHAPALDTATPMIESTQISAAVIDYELQGENGAHICDRLAEKGIPFLFYSASATSELERWGVPVLRKPLPCGAIVGALQGLLELSLRPMAETPAVT